VFERLTFRVHVGLEILQHVRLTFPS
jgi:hypothetical protein